MKIFYRTMHDKHLLKSGDKVLYGTLEAIYLMSYRNDMGKMMHLFHVSVPDGLQDHVVLELTSLKKITHGKVETKEEQACLF